MHGKGTSATGGRAFADCAGRWLEERADGRGGAFRAFSALALGGGRWALPTVAIASCLRTADADAGSFDARMTLVAQRCESSPPIPSGWAMPVESSASL